jgi:pimeloyl-ACP methyl ester carboxylesterase
MKNKMIKAASLILLVFISMQSIGQINYGSNNGKYLPVNGKKIYYEEYGSGTPLIMIHGGISNMSSFGTVIPELSKKFRVIAIDVPGEGRSEILDSISFQILASHISKMIDLLKLDSVYVYGYSVGGIIALHLTADRPDKVKMAVISSANYNYDGFDSTFGGDKLAPEFMEAYPKFWLDEHENKAPQKGKWKNYIQAFNKLWSPREFVPEAKLKQITNPVLIVIGDRDMIKPEHGLKMFHLIKGSQLAILPNTTHFVLWERPYLISRTVLDFFLKVKPVGSFF